MSYKIIKDAAGEMICWGPNDNNYEPSIPDGCTLEIVDVLPKPKPPSYTELRVAAYPSIEEQLDTIFHGGVTAWKTSIQKIKTTYPKV